MNQKYKYRVGSRVVEGGKVYRIFKIEEKKKNGKIRRILHYRPFFKEISDSTLVCSIPENSLDISNIRRPISKEAVGKMMTQLAKKGEVKTQIDHNIAKELLNSNDVYKVSKVVRKYWKEKRSNESEFTKNKKDILENAVGKIVEEVALAYKVSLKTAEEKIKLALQGK